MEQVTVKYIEKPQLADPILIEGLPGVGNVGKIAVEHMIEVLGAVHFATIHSSHLPAQVIVDEDGLAYLVSHKLYYHRREEGDLVFLTGDFQAVNHIGQYTLSSHMIDVAVSLGVKEIYTLGGYQVGHFVEAPRVFGAVNIADMVADLDKYDIVFGEGEPGSGIVGASGLLLGLGALHSIRGLCLMGETHGYIADPSSSRAILEILTAILGVEIDLEDLSRKAVEVERITTQIKDLAELLESGGGNDVGYIR